MRLRVMTLNVQNTEGPVERQDLLNELIRRFEPDVLSLQEVDSTGQLDQLLTGTDLTGTHQSQVLNYDPPFADRYGGTALATRWPHRVLEALDQRQTDAPDVPWCTLAAHVELPELGPVLVIASTSSWRLDAEAARERQALALADLDARHRTAVPTIIAADLNAGPDAASVRFLTGRQSLNGRSVSYHDAWELAGDGPAVTWDPRNPRAAAEMGAVIRQPLFRRRLDYVLVGSWHPHPEARAEVLAARLVGDTPRGEQWASDHFGMCVELAVELDESDG